ncbi:hypothetical protein FSP39_012325, partial [Pinctada imbricata]
QLLQSSRKVLGRRLFNGLVKPTLFRQFVGGDTEESITRAVQKLQNDGIGPMLMLPMEEDAGQETISETWYDRNLDLMIKGLKLTKSFGEKHPMLQIKLTALLSGSLCQRISECCPEPSAEPGTIETIANALLTRKSEARDLGVLILVDAEYTYLNPALNLLALAMMCHTADKQPIIMYTYQNYLKATHALLCRDVDFILANGVCFGSKLVRGAYMDKERKLAGIKVTRILMRMYDIEPTNDHVFFAQVYGMGDFMTVILGQSNYKVYKSIPYGIPEDTLPYLSRRVTENRAVLDGARRERILLKATLKERLVGRKQSIEN